MAKIEFEPIGYFRCPQNQPTDSPRQGVLASESLGYVELDTRYAGDCLRDLDGFTHVWLVYSFHKNQSWKPVVLPPRGGSVKRGVFATRSPYRPNSVGISVVELSRVEGKKVYCSKHDLLDGTPVLDIKPYLSYSDSIEKAGLGWTGETLEYQVTFSDLAFQKTQWLSEELGKSLIDIVSNQLKFDPLDSQKKRVKSMDGKNCLSYRTWRFDFTIEGETIQVCNLRSGYAEADLLSRDDPYMDKDIHRKFIKLLE